MIPALIKNIEKRDWLAMFAAAIVLMATSSCSTVLNNSKTSALSTDYCAPRLHYRDDTTKQVFVSKNALVAAKLDAHDYTLATHIGLLELLNQYSISETAEEKLNSKQKITERVLLLNTEMEAVVAELDCNGERYDQLARFLDARNHKVNTRLTVASIVTGAALAISTAIIKNNKVTNAVNISGGVAGAGLGFMLLNPKGKKIQLQTQHSLLNNVWHESNADNALPPALWRVLNEKAFSNEGKQSLIQTLKKRWLTFVFDDKLNKEDEQRFFGIKGYFNEEDLQHLADMHNQLQASIRTIQQDMRSLIAAINRI
ncbi:hypothetical protein [Mucilaginibacter sp. CSA2-8R]|uniref:hypothetical protein n=1 Tax=Mucilaginibacter sp. CSA2-8R TaxID=3141542 RepID=UPI00315DB22E